MVSSSLGRFDRSAGILWFAVEVQLFGDYLLRFLEMIFLHEGRGPEIGAVSDQISTPNLWGVLLITFQGNHLTPDLRSSGRDDLNDVSQWFPPPMFQKIILLDRES